MGGYRARVSAVDHGWLSCSSAVDHGWLTCSPRVSAVDHGWLMCSPRVSAVDHGFEPRSGQTKDYKIGICCFSTRHAALRKKSKDWFGSDSG